jgi:hypothetical protein
MAHPSTCALEQLRPILAVRVRSGSIGQVARDLGMTRLALTKFLSGGLPYTVNRQRLLEWWSRREDYFPEAPRAPGVLDALFGAVRALPPEQRRDAATELLATFARLHAAHPERCPAWVAGLVDAGAAEALP